MPKAKKAKRFASHHEPATVSEKRGDFTKYINNFRQEYEAVSNEKDAEQMKKYMRGQFAYFGLKSPIRRDIDKRVSLKH